MATEKHIQAADRVISAISSLERILSQQFVPGVNTLDNFIAMSGADRNDIEEALTAKGLVIAELSARIVLLRNMRDYINANTSFTPEITL